jgi:hypothetical protein
VSEPNLHQQTHFAIHIKEQIDPCWSSWFEGVRIRSLENGETILSGPVADHAALHGLLAKVRDLNLTLVSVTQIKPPREENA